MTVINEMSCQFWCIWKSLMPVSLRNLSQWHWGHRRSISADCAVSSRSQCLALDDACVMNSLPSLTTVICFHLRCFETHGEWRFWSDCFRTLPLLLHWIARLASTGQVLSWRFYPVCCLHLCLIGGDVHCFIHSGTSVIDTGTWGIWCRARHLHLQLERLLELGAGLGWFADLAFSGEHCSGKAHIRESHGLKFRTWILWIHFNLNSVNSVQGVNPTQCPPAHGHQSRPVAQDPAEDDL